MSNHKCYGVLWCLFYKCRYLQLFVLYMQVAAKVFSVKFKWIIFSVLTGYIYNIEHCILKCYFVNLRVIVVFFIECPLLWADTHHFWVFMHLSCLFIEVCKTVMYYILIVNSRTQWYNCLSIYFYVEHVPVSSHVILHCICLILFFVCLMKCITRECLVE